MKTKGSRRKVGLLVAALSVVLMPATALAGGPPTGFSATGGFSPGSPAWTISPGDVDPAGKSGLFVVKGRTVTGFLSGDIAGPFSFTFGTNVPLTQSGQIHGTFVAGPYEAKVHATSRLELGPGLAFGLGPEPVLVATLRVTGTLTFTEGTQGHGVVDAFFTVALNPETFHIEDVVPSGVPVFGAGPTFLGYTITEVSLSGEWHQ